MKTFDKKPTWDARAVQIWQILVSMAHNRQSTTYSQLSKLLGFTRTVRLTESLGSIMYYCNQNELPPLTVLIVSEKTGVPKEGLMLPGEENREREKVFKYNWYNIYPPTREEFAKAWNGY